MDENYVNLASAIVLQAYKDFQLACKHLYRNPEDEEAARTIREIKRFCLSPWCEFLTEVDGRWLFIQFKERAWDILLRGRTKS